MATDFAAYVASGSEAATTVYQYVPGTAAAEIMIPGSLVVFNTTNDEIENCGTDPALIAGICEVTSEDAKLLTDDGRIPIRVITGGNCRIALSSATTPVVATHLGVEYGLTEAASGNWQLTIAKVTTDSRCIVVDVDVANGIFYVIFHQNALQFTPHVVAQA